MKRIFILLTAIILCLPFVACKPKEEASSERIPFTVETNCVYSQDNKEELSDKIIAVIEKAIEIKIGYPLSEEELISLNEFIDKELFDSLQATPV